MNRFQTFQSVQVTDPSNTLYGCAGNVRSCETTDDNGVVSVDVYVDNLAEVVAIPVESLQAL